MNYKEGDQQQRIGNIFISGEEADKSYSESWCKTNKLRYEKGDENTRQTLLSRLAIRFYLVLGFSSGPLSLSTEGAVKMAPNVAVGQAGEDKDGISWDEHHQTETNDVVVLAAPLEQTGCGRLEVKEAAISEKWCHREADWE